MRFTAEEVEFLIQIVRDSTLGSSFHDRVTAISDALSILVPNTSLSAFVVDPRTDAAPLLLCRNRDAEILSDYATSYRHLDPMRRDFEAGSGRPAQMSDFVDDARWGRDEFTSDFMARFRVRHVLACSHLMPDGRVHAYALHRERSSPDFSARERELLRLVSPDLGRAVFAVLLREKVQALAVRADGADPMSGAIVFTPTGDVAHADQGALALARRIEPSTTLPIDALVAEVRGLAERPAVEGLVVERTLGLDRGAFLRVRFSRMGSNPGAQVLAVLEVLRPGTRAHVDAALDRARLTPRKRQVAELAARGLGNREIARALGLSPTTVNVHLGTIYARLGITGRSDLMALYLGRPPGAGP